MCSAYGEGLGRVLFDYGSSRPEYPRAQHPPGGSGDPAGDRPISSPAAAAYFFGREYVDNRRRGPGRAQSLRDWIMLSLTILGVVTLVGRYWK